VNRPGVFRSLRVPIHFDLLTLAQINRTTNVKAVPTSPERNHSAVTRKGKAFIKIGASSLYVTYALIPARNPRKAKPRIIFDRSNILYSHRDTNPKVMASIFGFKDLMVHGKIKYIQSEGFTSIVHEK